MKILAILLLATSAMAQSFNEPSRALGNARLNLTPLFQWWTQVRDYEHAVRTNRQRPKLPEKPLSAWSRITTTEITISGNIAIAEARVQTSPLSNAVTQMIVIRHAPLNAKREFDSAVAGYKNAEAQAKRSRAAESTYRANANYQTGRANQYYETYQDVGGTSYLNAGRNRSAAARAANLKANAAERNALNAQMQQDRYKQVTKGRMKFQIDDFAVNTGEVYNGMPVYDLGFPFGR